MKWKGFGDYYANNYDRKRINGFTIYGIKGTAAETYANENGFTFIPIGDMNGDGYVNVKDVTEIQHKAAELI